MQKTILKQDLLNDIQNESNGFRFGEIWRLSDKSLGTLVPILRHKDFKRDYVMIEEIDPKKYKVKDSGNIDEIKIKSSFNKPVFIRTGNMFEGEGTQSRASEFSVVIVPEGQTEEVIIPARCVHASHHIAGGASFKRYGYAPREVLYSLSSGSGQREVWASVSRSSARLFTAGGGEARYARASLSDNMVENLKQIKKGKSAVSDIIKKVPCLENQVGVVILDEEGVSNLEVFDHPDSWKAFHENIIESYSDILSKEQKEPLFELKKEAVPNKIKEFIEGMIETKEDSAFEEKQTSTIIFRGKSILGEYTILNENIIHLLAFREEKHSSEINWTRERPILSGARFSTTATSRRESPLVYSSR